MTMIEDRLAALERSARRLRCAVLFLGALLALVVLSGQGASSRDALSVKSLDAEEITVATEKGSITLRVRGTHPEIWLKEAKRSNRVRLDSNGLFLYNAAGISVGTFTWQGGVQLSPPDVADGNDRRSVFLRALNGAGGELWLGDHETNVTCRASASFASGVRVRGSGFEHLALWTKDPKQAAEEK